MNPIQTAIQDLHFTIPSEILNIVFKNTNAFGRQVPISLDNMILERVIRPRVLLNSNLIGGKESIIDISSIQPEYIDNYNLLYQIDKKHTGNRIILSVMDIGFLPYNSVYGSGGTMSFGGIAPTNTNEITNVANRIMDSVSSIPPISNSHVELIGENAVLITSRYIITQAFFIRCVLSNSEELNELSIRSHPKFTMLCQLAVKSYIYNTLIIQIDRGYLESGLELGAVKVYVESLADAESMYQTYLNEVMRSTFVMNDQTEHQRHIKRMIPGCL